MKKYSLLLLLSCMCVLPVQAKSAKDFDSIRDTMLFWAYQEKEHAEFCEDFASNEKLKSEAKKLADQFETISKDKNPNKNEFLKITGQLKKLQKKVKGSLDAKDQDYSIKKDLLDHMDLEAQYIEKKVRGKISPKDELNFWKEEHAGEAKATAYYMQQDDDLKDETQEISKELKAKNDKTDEKDMVMSANQDLDEISAELKSKPQKTRMPKKLAEHEKRERHRARKILERQ